MSLRRNTAQKLTLAVGATLVLLLGAALGFMVEFLQKRLVHEVNTSGHRLSDTIKRSLRYSMLHDDREAISRTIRALGDQADLSGVDIFNKDGKIMFSAHPERLGKTVDVRDIACRACHASGPPVATVDPNERTSIYVNDHKARVLQIIDPLYNGPDCTAAGCHVHPPGQKVLGVMAVSLSLLRIDQALKRARNTALLVGTAVVFLICGAVFLLMRRLVTGRITALVEGTRGVSAGNLELRIPDMGNDEFGLLATSFNDMTAALRDTRGRLLRSEKLASIGRLSAGIAHEINNPLTGVLLLTTAMLEQMEPGDPRLQDLRTVVGETKRCRETIKGLLDFARPSEPRQTSVPLDEVVERAVRVVASQCARRGVTLEVLPAGASPRVHVDVDQIQQVLLNLLLNAMDAVTEGGKITLSWRLVEEGGGVEVDLADNGVGIAPENLPKVFEPFFTTKEKGTGLGLAICWGIVEQHGGTISIVSEEGRGTTFKVRLPLGKEEEGGGAQ